MRYVIQLYSEEEEEVFMLMIRIDVGATFLQLHELIVEACGYDSSQMASFFTVNEQGQRLQEISLMEMSSEETELNEAVMDVSTLEEFIGKDSHALEYQFDFFADRYFTLLLKEVQKGEQAEAVVLSQKGTAPPQLSLEGFEEIDFSTNNESKEIDYEKYLSSFDDCIDDDVDYQSLEEWEDEDFQ